MRVNGRKIKAREEKQNDIRLCVSSKRQTIMYEYIGRDDFPFVINLLLLSYW